MGIVLIQKLLVLFDVNDQESWNELIEEIVPEIRSIMIIILAWPCFIKPYLRECRLKAADLQYEREKEVYGTDIVNR